MHGADAGRERRAWLAKLDRVAVEEHAARVGTVHAGDDLDEGRFAGAVLAHQGVDLARLQVERDVIERSNARERLADAFDRQIHQPLPDLDGARSG